MESNKADNFEAIFCTMCLITIEMGGDDILVELIRLALDIQVKQNALKEFLSTDLSFVFTRDQ